jgi:Ser/Thr protein kinase RdoA (MazF antagonist)
MSQCGVYIPVWQWAEDNQGFLSVLALVAALAIAVFEVIRAARAERRRKEEYVDLVGGILGKLAERLKEVAAGSPDNQRADIWSAWRQAESAVNIVRPSAPPDAELALALAELAEFFLGNVPSATAGPNNYLERATRLQEFRKRVIGRRSAR